MKCVFVKAKHFADFACSRAASVGDDVCRHRGAQLTITLVHVLDGLLALVTGRQIEINVGPLAPVLAQEPLKKQTHVDRIRSRNAERIAGDGVRSRTAPLDQNVVILAKLDDIPNDKKVAFKAKLFDESQLYVCLPAGTGVSLPAHAAAEAIPQTGFYLLT